MNAKSSANALAALDSLKALQTGWDSYEAAPPDPFALKYARDCLLNVAQALGPSYANPGVGPTADAGVALVWRKKGQGAVDALFTSAGGRYVVTGSDRGFITKGVIRDPVFFAREVLKQYLAL